MSSANWRKSARAGLVAVALAFSLPAAAAPSNATATVDRQQVLAGSLNLNFNVTVSLEVGTAPQVNDVRILVPTAGATRLVTPLGGQASGWSASILPDGSGVAFTGGTLAPGQSKSFTVRGDVARPASDTAGEWAVSVSDATGDPASQAQPAQPGGLSTTVKVLEVSGLSIVAPSGAADGTVTAGQEGVCARFDVRNTGAGAPVVTPAITGQRVTASAPRQGASPPCAGSPLAGGKIGIASGATVTVDVQLSFGTAGSTSLQATANGDGASASATMAVEIQPAASLSYLENSIQPRGVRPGQQDVQFLVGVVKSAGSPAISFDLQAGRLSFSACPPLRMTSPDDIPAGGWNQYLVFEPCDIPNAPDGRYPASVIYRYTDENGATLDASFSITSGVRLDSRAPEVSVTLTPPPASQVAGQAPAFTNGSSFQFSGSLADSHPESGNPVPCPECVIVRAATLFFPTATCTGPPVEQSLSVSREGSQFSGGGTLTFPAGIQSMGIELIARDQTGNEGVGRSLCYEVDTISPRVVQAKTIKVGGQNTGVQLTLSECVVGTSGILDWSVGSPVTDVGPASCAGGVPTIILQVALPFADGHATTTGSYAPFANGALAPGYHDRVGLSMPGQSFQIQNGLG